MVYTIMRIIREAVNYVVWVKTSIVFNSLTSREKRWNQKPSHLLYYHNKNVYCFNLHSSIKTQLDFYLNWAVLV